MWKELLTLAFLYVIVIGGHAVHQRVARWYDARKETEARAEALDAISPFPRIVHVGARHACAVAVAGVFHPVTLETCKHYIVHFLIYSGYVIPH